MEACPNSATAISLSVTQRHVQKTGKEWSKHETTKKAAKQSIPNLDGVLESGYGPLKPSALLGVSSG